MNINEYISSGILEQYVLGDVTPQEQKEVQCLSHIYPEIKEALQSLELVMEKVALQEAITPAEHVKTKLFAQIKAQDEAIPKQAPIVNMTLTKNTTTYSYNRLVAAASVLLVVVVAYLFYANNKQSTEIAMLTKTIETAKISYDSLASSNKNLATNLSVLSNPATKQYSLPGNEKVGKTNITIYFNKDQQKVLLAGVNFPTPAADKQYQLWALVDGKPIDLGVFDVTTSVQVMKQISNAQAFAITLEKKGGMPTPDLTQLCGIVNI